MKIFENDDLAVLEFLKEARIIRRQLQLMKNNLDKISSDNLIKILNISEIIEAQFKDLKKESEDVLTKDGWKMYKSMQNKKL